MTEFKLSTATLVSVEGELDLSTAEELANLDEAIEWLGAGTNEAVPPQWWIAASTPGGPSLASPTR